MLPLLVKNSHRIKFLLKDNSTTILTAVGVGGTVATAYLTGRATFRAAEIIAQEEGKNPEYRGEKLEKVKLVWQGYIPPAAMGIITITSIIAANRISSRKIAALVVASGISDRALNEYKAKIVEKFGERKETTMRDEIAQERVLANPANSREIVMAGVGEVLCFDMLTGRYFQSTVEEIRRAENRVNYEMIHFMHASLSMFYEEIGLPPTPYTDSVGWNMNNHMEVKLSTVLSENNRPCIAIDFSKQPLPDYDNTWR
jgi:hypothetical protein